LPRLSLLVSCCSKKQQVRVSTWVWVRFRWKSWGSVGHFCVEINMLDTSSFRRSRTVRFSESDFGVNPCLAAKSTILIELGMFMSGGFFLPPAIMLQLRHGLCLVLPPIRRNDLRGSAPTPRGERAWFHRQMASCPCATVHAGAQGCTGWPIPCRT